jgi:hypothetical protein
MRSFLLQKSSDKKSTVWTMATPASRSNCDNSPENIEPKKLWYHKAWKVKGRTTRDYLEKQKRKDPSTLIRWWNQPTPMPR